MGIRVVFKGLGGLEGDMRIGVVSRVKGDWKWFFFSGGCVVHCVGGRWGLGRCSRVWGAWKGFSFSWGVSGSLCRWEMGIVTFFGGLGGPGRGFSLVRGCLVHCALPPLNPLAPHKGLK